MMRSVQVRGTRTHALVEGGSPETSVGATVACAVDVITAVTCTVDVITAVGAPGVPSSAGDDAPHATASTAAPPTTATTQHQRIHARTAVLSTRDRSDIALHLPHVMVDRVTPYAHTRSIIDTYKARIRGPSTSSTPSHTPRDTDAVGALYTTCQSCRRDIPATSSGRDTSQTQRYCTASMLPGTAGIQPARMMRAGCPRSQARRLRRRAMPRPRPHPPRASTPHDI